MTTKCSVVVLGGDTDGNLGDSAILEGTVRIIRDVVPHAAITVPTDGTLARRGIDAVQHVPRGMRGIIGLLRAVASSRLVIVGGGGLFQDDDSLVKMPYWALRCLVVRALNSRIIGCSLGVGPLSAPMNHIAARIAFGTMSAISVRDNAAGTISRALTQKPVTVTADPALLCDARTPEAADEFLRERDIPAGSGPLIGISPRRYFPPAKRWIPHKVYRRLPGYTKPAAASELLIQRYAAALRELIDRHQARLLFLPTYSVEHEGDDEICRQIQLLLPARSTGLAEIMDPAMFKAVTGRLDLMVSGRMHAAILAASNGTPVVGVTYNPKFDEFFAAIGQQRFLISVDEFLAPDGSRRLADAAEVAAAGQPEVAGRIAALEQQLRDWLSHHVKLACDT